MLAIGGADIVRLRLREVGFDDPQDRLDALGPSVDPPPLKPPPRNEDLVGSKDTVLALVPNISSGNLVLCVTCKYVIVLSCNEEMDWAPVGFCERPAFGGKLDSAQAAWNHDSTAFVVCNSLGIAEFYQVASFYGKAAASVQAVRLSLPGWIVGPKEETRSGKLLKVTYRCSINSTVDGEQISLHSVVMNRMWLVMGTSRGTVIRVLWTGEIVTEKEIPVLNAVPEEQERNGQTIIQVDIGFQQRIGFVSQGGRAGVVADRQTNHIVVLAKENAKSISLHKTQPLVVVGFKDGSIELHAIGNINSEIIRTIKFPTDDLPTHLHETKTHGATMVMWNPDMSDFFAVGYENIGYMIWYKSGCKIVSFFLQQGRLGADFVPCFGWTMLGYNFVTNQLATVKTVSSDGKQKNSDDDVLFLQSVQLVKSCSLSPEAVAGNTSTCLQGWNYILSLQNQEWDVNSLSWQRIDLPPIYIQNNWPIRMVALSPDGNYLAVSGKQGCAIYSKNSKGWTLFSSVDEEKDIACKALFWLNNEVICMVHREPSTRSWELLCFGRDRLEMSQLLGKSTLPARPLAIDTAPGIIIFMFHDRLCMYQAQIKRSADDDDDEDEEDENDDDNDESLHRQLQHLHDEDGRFGLEPSDAQKSKRFIIRRASSATETAAQQFVEGIRIDMVETIKLMFDPIEVPSTLSVMPVGGTKRAGINVKLPKCAILTSRGYLYVVDTEDESKSIVAKGIYGIMPQSWQKIEQADDVVLAYLEREEAVRKQLRLQRSSTSNNSIDPVVVDHIKEENDTNDDYCETPRLPAMLLYSLWLVDERGLRLWLPSLDIMGESLDTKCADFSWDVLPLGILESHGLVLGITQLTRSVTKFKTPCYEVSVRVTPTTHAILQWVIKQHRTDLASQVLIQSSTHLTLFSNMIDLLLFNITEEDYKHRNEEGYEPLLPMTTKLLRTGKVVAILDSKLYNAIVVQCARKMESSRWTLFFKCAGNPEQVFNDSIYSSDLKTAAGSMIIADYFSPEKSSKRIAALAHAAALKKDEKLLEEIKHFQMTKLA